ITSVKDRIRRDLLLTDAFCGVLHDMGSGKFNPAAVRADSLDIALLRGAIRGGRIATPIVSREPTVAGYVALKPGLRWLLDRASTGSRDSLLRGLTNLTGPHHRDIRTVEINLERWRWERKPLGERYIYVNIPSFMVQVMLHDLPILESRAIV